MKLKKISLQRIPGFKFSGITLETLSAGLNIILGPNGSGKSSICQAASKLLWPDKAPHMSQGIIDSEWINHSESFFITIEGGLQKISDPKHLQNIPDSSFANCFNLAIDDFFDKKTLDFNEKISLAISRGCDIKAAQERLTPTPTTKSAIQEWKRAKQELKEYREIEKTLLHEEASLPQLQKAIEEAKTASTLSKQLEIIIAAKKIKEKITLLEQELEKRAKEISQEQSLQTQNALSKEIDTLSSEIDSLENMLYSQNSLASKHPTEEIEKELSRITTLKQIEREKEILQKKITALKATLNTTSHFLGITNEETIANLSLHTLNDVEEEWKHQTLLEIDIHTLQEQIRLNKAPSTPPEQGYQEKITLMIEHLSQPQQHLYPLLLTTSCTLIAALATFLLTTHTHLRILTLIPLLPLSYLWITAFQNKKHQETLNKRLSKIEEATPTRENLLTLLHKNIRNLAKELQNELTHHRQAHLLNQLEHKLLQQKRHKECLLQKAEAIGIHQLPPSLHRFTDLLKQLHLQWIELKETLLELEELNKESEQEWDKWHAFTKLHGESPSKNIHDLTKISTRIKQRQEIKLLKNKWNEYALALGPLIHRTSEELLSLESEKQRLKEKAEALSELSEKKGTITAKLSQSIASARNTLLTENENKAFCNLQNTIRDFSRKKLLEILVSETQQEFQRDSQPKVLQKAAEWFQRFTQGKYLLQTPIQNNGSITYQAQETSTGEIKQLEELSRGTRMQLLIAIRLSIAFEQENTSSPLPLFLDEILSNSDHERFKAITEVIGELVNTGRQIFYFTCNQDEAKRWTQHLPTSHIIHLT